MPDATVYGVLLSVGSVGVVYGLVQLRKARGSRRWPVCEAVVVKSTLKGSKGGRGGPKFEPDVRYRYSYGGATYEGGRIMFSGIPFRSTREDVEQFLEYLPEGERIPVRVCPRDPRVSVILPGIDRNLLLLLFCASYIAFTGSGGLLGWWDGPTSAESIHQCGEKCPEIERPRPPAQ
jgi:uncharacterized protein DUF3592